MDELLNLKEATRRLGLKDPSALRHAIKRGWLQAEKVGRDWVVRASDLERYANEHQPRPRNREE